jgi:hypothetical protein
MSQRTLATAADILHNSVVKTYPDGSQEITVSRYRMFRERGFEDASWKKRPRSPADHGNDADNRQRSVRRARSRIRDYARSNRFSYFVTLTLSPEKALDRYDIRACVKQMTGWLDNRCRRKGLIYILVPEHHKDGALHFHGFINDALPLEDSGTLSNGGKPRRPRGNKERERLLSEGWRIVYNVPDWSFGFSTAIELYGDYEAAITYCCKYVGKEMEKGNRGGEAAPEPAGKIGGRWYYSGGGLRLPELSALDFDFDRLAEEHPHSVWSMAGARPDMVRFFVKEGWNFDGSYVLSADPLERDYGPGASGVFRDCDSGEPLPEEWCR